MFEQLRDLRNGSDYHFNVADPYTPNSSQAGPLVTELPNPKIWGTTPYDYVLWFDRLWHTGDPSGWGPDVFSPTTVMIDPTGTSYGPGPASSDFLLLFQYFPQLRGEVVSWAANDTEVMINWRFFVRSGEVCPVVDKFSFVGGLVSFREAYFDTMMLLSYLSENYGCGAMFDYFADRFWSSASSGTGMLFLPSLVKALAVGLVTWTDLPPAAPGGLQATPGRHCIELQWDRVDGAKSYTVKRSTSPGGPYGWIKAYHKETSYIDRNVVPGKQYYYVVSSNAVDHQPLPPVTPPRPSRARLTPGTKPRKRTKAPAPARIEVRAPQHERGRT